MTEARKASYTHIRIFLKTDIFFSPFSQKKHKPIRVNTKTLKQRKKRELLTEHALYHV